ncbi:MAG: ABC transporter ATP-binding protein [Flavobacteriales bacterium]|nr:ABC transporter ATP-binding protein [Flavobacteriales bacterium]
MSLLEIKEVSKIYTNHKALDHVSLKVPKGSIYGLLGPNGAGKTSLIRIINQITAPDTGSLYFNGEALSEKHIYKIGYLPEERGLYKKQPVWDQILYFAQLKGLSISEAKQKTLYWLKKFDILSWKQKKVEELSKGMQQKIQFIITVLHEPELLILDEPFSGFDPLNADLIKEEIKGMRARGTTILYSTHRMESVEEICDYICLINKSKKILDGSVKEIKTAGKQHHFELVFEGRLPEWISEPESLSEEEGKTKVVFKAENMDRSEIIKKLANEVNIWSFRELIPSIHQIFIEKVKEAQHA